MSLCRRGGDCPQNGPSLVLRAVGMLTDEERLDPGQFMVRGESGGRVGVGEVEVFVVVLLPEGNVVAGDVVGGVQLDV